MVSTECLLLSYNQKKKKNPKLEPSVTYDSFFPPLTIVLVCLSAIEMLLATNIPEAEPLKENVFEFNNCKGCFLGNE